MMRSSILGASTMLNVLIQHLPLQSLSWTKIWRAFRALDPSILNHPIKILRTRRSRAVPSSRDEIKSRPSINDRTVIERRRRFVNRHAIRVVDRDQLFNPTATPISEIFLKPFFAKKNKFAILRQILLV